MSMVTTRRPALLLLAMGASAMVLAQATTPLQQGKLQQQVQGALVSGVPASPPSLGGLRGGAPPNDLCQDVTAFSIAPGVPVVRTGNSDGATDTEGLGAAQVWEMFTTTVCMDLQIELCGTTPPWADTWITLFIGCPISSSIGTSLFNNTNCADGNWTVNWSQLPAGTYYFPVLSAPGSTGPYTLTFSGTACGGSAPVNNDCSGAIGLTLTATCQPVTGTTLNATGSLPAVDCNGLTGVADDDVWYSFTASSSDHTIDVTGSSGFDAVIELFEGPCSSPVSLGCSDATMNGGLERIEATGLTPGATYLVRVYHFGAGAPSTNTFEICVYDALATGPVNDACGSVTPELLPIGGSVVFTGTTVGATLSGDYAPGTILDGAPPAVWHAIELQECGDLVVSYCNTAPAFQNVFSVLATSCPADDNLVFEDSLNVTVCGNDNYTIYLSGLAAGIYYLPVLFDQQLANGAYEVQVSATACPPVPANDLCADAQSLPINAPADCPANAVAGDNGNATQDGGDPGCAATGTGYQDVWYTFNAGTNDTITITFSPGTMTDWTVVVLDGCLGAELACVQSPAAPFEVAVNPGADHIVRVLTDLDNGVGGTFEICLSAAEIAATCDGGSVSTVDQETVVNVCSDGVADIIDFISTTTSASSYAFILTSADDLIITQLAGNSLDFNTAALGTYHVYGVSYDGMLTGVIPGEPIAGVGSDGDCAELSVDFVIVNVEICSSVSEGSEGDWTVFPNPASGVLFVRNRSSLPDATLELIDASGRVVVREQAVISQGSVFSFDAAGRVAPGSYVLRMTTDQGRSEHRVLLR